MAKKKLLSIYAEEDFVANLAAMAKRFNKPTAVFVVQVMESFMNDPDAFALHLAAKESPQTSGRYGFIREVIALAKKYSAVLAENEKDALRTLVDVSGKNLAQQISVAVQQPENTTV